MTEEALFHAVLAVPAADRPAYLSEHCRDPELRRRVEELLAAHDKPAGPLDASPATGDFQPGSESAIPNPISEIRQIGPYKLLQRIGEGGMGAVYMAEQQRPVRRMVAVKIIKPGMDSAQVVARFEAERQALAMMDHPNIARILDGGMTGEPGASAAELRHPAADAAGSPGAGLPYFVMELVKGIPITKYCDQQHLTPRERLELFVPVCHAVQHAHQKGVIHRDLKPTNVLVALYDGRPVPKVIDFGVAKALHNRLTEKTMFTEFGAIVGTLEYMSPEQAELNQLDIDTRSDIYSLGVLLYELLTGSTPFDRKRLKSAAFDELLRIIREEEPPKPSTRLSASEELPSIAANRRTEPKRLGKLVRGELDWVVMKCLEKDCARRYETANGLAMDVQRYLADDMVQARPPTAGYRMRKFWRRNKRAVLAAAVIVLLLVGGVAGTTTGWVQAQRERAAAIEEARKATAAADAERAATALANRRLPQVEKGADILAWIFHELTPGTEEKGGPGLQERLRARLRKAADRVDAEEIGDPATVARLKCNLGIALLGLGENELSLQLLTKAYEAHEALFGANDPITLKTLGALGLAYRANGQAAKAVELLDRCWKGRSARFGADDRQTLITLDNLACAHRTAGQDARAIELHEQCLARMRVCLGPIDPDTLVAIGNLAAGYRDTKQTAKAIPLLEQCVEQTQTAFHDDHPFNLTAQNNLAQAYMDLGEAAKAVPLLEHCLARTRVALGADHPMIPNYRISLARAYQATNQPAKIVPLLEDEFTQTRAKYGAVHENTLAATSKLAIGYLAANRPADATPLIRDYIATRRRLDEKRPDLMARTLANIGKSLVQYGQFVEAEPLLRESLEWRQKHLPAGDWRTADAQSLLGAALAGQKKHTEAEPLLLSGYDSMKQREGAIPEKENARLREAAERLVQLYEAWGKPAEAAKWKAEADALKVNAPVK